MDKLSSLSAASPETRTVDLSNSGITSLDSILPVLAKLPRLHTLDLEKNELIALPKDLSRLARLQRLDVSQNPFASVQQILPGLQSIPLLEVLFVDVDGEEDRSALLAALPQLIQLNNEPVKLQEVLEVEDAPADAFLDKVNKVADKIRKLRVGRENFREERLKARLSELTADLESKRALPSDSLQNKRSIALTKRAFVICLKETLRPLLEPAAQSLAQDLETLDGELFEELSEVVLALAPASPLRSARRMEEAASEQSDSSTEQVPGTPNRQKPNAELLENISLKTKVENLETELFEATSKLQEKSACEAQLMRQMTSLLGAQKALEVELKGYQDLLQRERSKTSDLEALLFDSQRAPDSVVKAKDAKNSADLRRTEDLTLLYRSVSNERLRKSHAVSLRGSTVGDGRGISFKHILVTIVDVYQSKEKSDARNREMHQPLETLAEHLQNYLNKKYGLKVLTTTESEGALLKRSVLRSGFLQHQRLRRETVQLPAREQGGGRLPTSARALQGKGACVPARREDQRRQEAQAGGL